MYTVTENFYYNKNGETKVYTKAICQIDCVNSQSLEKLRNALSYIYSVPLSEPKYNGRGYRLHSMDKQYVFIVEELPTIYQLVEEHEDLEQAYREAAL